MGNAILRAGDTRAPLSIGSNFHRQTFSALNIYNTAYRLKSQTSTGNRALGRGARMLSKVQISFIPHHQTYAAQLGTARRPPDPPGERRAERSTRAGRPPARLAGRWAPGLPRSPRKALAAEAPACEKRVLWDNLETSAVCCTESRGKGAQAMPLPGLWLLCKRCGWH